MTVPTNVKQLIQAIISGMEALDLVRLHNKADTDAQPLAVHHTLGPRGFQASPGDHMHDGRTSRKLYGDTPVAITGSRGGNVALANLLNQLDTLGIIDNQTSA